MRESARTAPLRPGLATLAAVLTGLLYWLAFPGVNAWPLAFVAFVPLLLALREQSPRNAFRFGLIAGFTMNVAGFSWLLGMLRAFSGLPVAVCLAIALLICIWQGGRIALMSWLLARGVQHGWPRAVVALGAFAASELAFPLLFPWYFGATVFRVHALAQVAELGGPVLVGLTLLGANLAFEELVLASLVRRAVKRRLVLAGIAGVVASALFGVARMAQVDRRARTSEPLHVGIVQGNLGLFEKRDRALDGIRRQQRLTAELAKRGVDLVVWSETSVSLSVPEEGYAASYRAAVTASLGVQAIFGGIIVRNAADASRARYFNSALASDGHGDITGRYDKRRLLPFSEALPLADAVPRLRRWLPHLGRFSPGSSSTPLPFVTRTGTHAATVLICYEDIMPSFTNQMVRRAQPDLLVNITNDAWFGDTSEPEEHLALATFRSIEHRRYLVRSTNSGISAFIDPAGRIMARSHLFRAEGLDAVVHLMQGRTVYEVIGDLPAWLLAAVIAVFAFRRRSGQWAAKGTALQSQ